MTRRMKIMMLVALIFANSIALAYLSQQERPFPLSLFPRSTVAPDITIPVTSADRVLWSPDGTILVTVQQTHIALWRLNDGNESVAQFDFDYSSLRWEFDGRLLATSNNEQRVLWTLDSDTNYSMPRAVDIDSAWYDVTFPINAVAMSFDSRQVAFGGGFDEGEFACTLDAPCLQDENDTRIYVIDAETSEQLAVLSGHENVVQYLFWHPDNLHLISLGDDNFIRVWDVATQEQVNAIRIAGRVRSAALSPDGERIAIARYDETVGIWNVFPITPRR